MSRTQRHLGRLKRDPAYRRRFMRSLGASIGASLGVPALVPLVVRFGYGDEADRDRLATTGTRDIFADPVPPTEAEIAAFDAANVPDRFDLLD